MNVKDVGYEGAVWIHIPEDREHWRAFVGAVIKLPVHYKAGNFLTR